MRHLIPLAGLIALAGCGASVDAADPSADRTAIEAMIREAETANNSGDVDRWVGLFAPEAVYMPPGMPAVSGEESLRDVAAAGFSAAVARIAIEPQDIVIAGDHAIARSEVRGDATLTSDGTRIEVNLKQVAVYRRQSDGSWRITHLIMNRNSE